MRLHVVSTVSDEILLIDIPLTIDGSLVLSVHIL